MNDSLEEGMAFQHASNQTYVFLQQDIIEEAEKVGINIVLNNKKIAMYEIDLDEFIIVDDEPMAQLVLDAAVVKMMTPKVEEYVDIMELKYNKK